MDRNCSSLYTPVTDSILHVSDTEKKMNQNMGETLLKTKKCSVAVKEVTNDANMQAIFISHALMEMLVKDPVCGRSDYSDLPGVSRGTCSSWRSYAEYPRRAYTAARHQRNPSASTEERRQRNDEAKLRREKLTLQRVAKRERLRAQQHERRRQQTLMDKLQDQTSNEDSSLFYPGVIISSPKKKSPRKPARKDQKEDIYLPKVVNFGESSTRSSLEDVSVKPHDNLKSNASNGVSNFKIDNERKMGLEAVVSTTTTHHDENAPEGSKILSALVNKSQDKNIIIDPFREFEDNPVTSSSQDNSESSLVKPVSGNGSRSFVSTTCIVTSTTTPEIADADSSTTLTSRRKTRNVKRVDYTEMLEDDFDQDLEKQPFRESVNSGRKIRPVKRTLEKAIVDASLKKSPRKRKTTVDKKGDKSGSLPALSNTSANVGKVKRTKSISKIPVASADSGAGNSNIVTKVVAGGRQNEATSSAVLMDIPDQHITAPADAIVQPHSYLPNSVSQGSFPVFSAFNSPSVPNRQMANSDQFVGSVHSHTPLTFQPNIYTLAQQSYSPSLRYTVPIHPPAVKTSYGLQNTTSLGQTAPLHPSPIILSCGLQSPTLTELNTFSSALQSPQRKSLNSLTAPDANRVPRSHVSFSQADMQLCTPAPLVSVISSYPKDTIVYDMNQSVQPEDLFLGPLTCVTTPERLEAGHMNTSQRITRQEAAASTAECLDYTVSIGYGSANTSLNPSVSFQHQQSSYSQNAVTNNNLSKLWTPPKQINSHDSSVYSPTAVRNECAYKNNTETVRGRKRSQFDIQTMLRSIQEENKQRQNMNPTETIFDKCKTNPRSDSAVLSPQETTVMTRLISQGVPAFIPKLKEASQTPSQFVTSSPVSGLSGLSRYSSGQGAPPQPSLQTMDKALATSIGPPPPLISMSELLNASVAVPSSGIKHSSPVSLTYENFRSFTTPCNQLVVPSTAALPSVFQPVLQNASASSEIGAPAEGLMQRWVMTTKPSGTSQHQVMFQSARPLLSHSATHCPDAVSLSSKIRSAHQPSRQHPEELCKIPTQMSHGNNLSRREMTKGQLTIMSGHYPADKSVADSAVAHRHLTSEKGVVPRIIHAGARLQVTVTQGVRPQGSVTQSVRPQISVTQGVRPQVSATHGVRPQISVAQGVRPQVSATHGMRPQVSVTQGLRPQISVTHGVRPQVSATQGVRPQIPITHGVRPQIPVTQGGRPQVPVTQGVRPQILVTQGGRPHVLVTQGGRPQVLSAPGGRPAVLSAPGGRRQVLSAPGARPKVPSIQEGTHRPVESPDESLPSVQGMQGVPLQVAANKWDGPAAHHVSVHIHTQATGANLTSPAAKSETGLLSEAHGQSLRAANIKNEIAEPIGESAAGNNPQIRMLLETSTTDYPQLQSVVSQTCKQDPTYNPKNTNDAKLPPQMVQSYSIADRQRPLQPDRTPVKSLQNSSMASPSRLSHPTMQNANLNALSQLANQTGKSAFSTLQQQGSSGICNPLSTLQPLQEKSDLEMNMLAYTLDLSQTSTCSRQKPAAVQVTTSIHHLATSSCSLPPGNTAANTNKIVQANSDYTRPRIKQEVVSQSGPTDNNNTHPSDHDSTHPTDYGSTHSTDYDNSHGSQPGLNWLKTEERMASCHSEEGRSLSVASSLSSAHNTTHNSISAREFTRVQVSEAVLNLGNNTCAAVNSGHNTCTAVNSKTNTCTRVSSGNITCTTASSSPMSVQALINNSRAAGEQRISIKVEDHFGIREYSEPASASPVEAVINTTPLPVCHAPSLETTRQIPELATSGISGPELSGPEVSVPHIRGERDNQANSERSLPPQHKSAEKMDSLPVHIRIKQELHTDAMENLLSSSSSSVSCMLPSPTQLSIASSVPSNSMSFATSESFNTILDSASAPVNISKDVMAAKHSFQPSSNITQPVFSPKSLQGSSGTVPFTTDHSPDFQPSSSTVASQANYVNDLDNCKLRMRTQSRVSSQETPAPASQAHYVNVLDNCTSGTSTHSRFPSQNLARASQSYDVCKPVNCTSGTIVHSTPAKDTLVKVEQGSFFDSTSVAETSSLLANSDLTNRLVTVSQWMVPPSLSAVPTDPTIAEETSSSNLANNDCHDQRGTTQISVMIPSMQSTGSLNKAVITKTSPSISNSVLNDPLFAWQTDSNKQANVFSLDDMTNPLVQDYEQSVSSLFGDIPLNMSLYTVTVSNPSTDSKDQLDCDAESSTIDTNVIKVEPSVQPALNQREVIDLCLSDSEENDLTETESLSGLQIASHSSGDLATHFACSLKSHNILQNVETVLPAINTSDRYLSMNHLSASQETPVKEHSISVTQPSPAKECSFSVKQPLPSVGVSISVAQPSPAKKYSASLTQPSPAMEFSKSLMQTSPAKGYSVSSMQPTPAKEYSVSLMKPTLAKEYSISSMQPAPAKEYSVSSMQPTPAKEHYVSSMQPTPAKEYSVSSMQLTPAKEYSVSVTSCPQDPESLLEKSAISDTGIVKSEGMPMMKYPATGQNVPVSGEHEAFIQGHLAKVNTDLTSTASGVSEFEKSLTSTILSNTVSVNRVDLAVCNSSTAADESKHLPLTLNASVAKASSVVTRPTQLPVNTLRAPKSGDVASTFRTYDKRFSSPKMQPRGIEVKTEHVECINIDEDDYDMCLPEPEMGHPSKTLEGCLPRGSSYSTFETSPVKSFSSASASSDLSCWSGATIREQCSHSVSSVAPLSHANSSGRGQLLAFVANWTAAEVTEWLQKHKLDKVCPNLSSLDGHGLQRMAFEYQRDPDMFYTRVKKTLGLTFFQTMVICHSMKELSGGSGVDEC